MLRIASLSFALAAVACTGTYYPSSSAGPQYASASTQQVSQSSDGATTTTTSSTQTYAFQSNEPAPQPAAYEPPPPPPPSDEPAPPSLCHPRDTANMCVALTVIVDVGDIITAARGESCREAARSLNRYADSHAREIDTLIRLRELESPARLAAWEDRHRSQAEGVMMVALELDARCEHNEKLDRALRRIGFSGLIGSRAL